MHQAKAIESNINLQIDTYTYQEAIQFRRFVNRRSWSVWGTKALAILIFIVSLGWIWSYASVGIPFTLFNYLIPIAGIVGAVLRIFDLVYIFQTRRYFQALETDKSLLSQQIINFSDDGIRLQTDTLTRRFHWDYFQKVIETEDHFLFPHYREPNVVYWMIPKRCFPSTENINYLRNLLDEELPHGK